jgi:hypothetical protein
VTEDQDGPAEGVIPAKVRQNPQKIPTFSVTFLQISVNAFTGLRDSQEIIFEAMIIKARSDTKQRAADIFVRKPVDLPNFLRKTANEKILVDENCRYRANFHEIVQLAPEAVYLSDLD